MTEEVLAHEACQLTVREVSGPTACHLRAGHEGFCKDYLDLRTARLVETQRELARVTGEVKRVVADLRQHVEDPCDHSGEYRRALQDTAQDLERMLKP